MSILFRNLLGFLLLVAVQFVFDQNSFQERKGFNKFSPYFFLLLMYGWIMVHNVFLFKGLYLQGKKKQYFTFTLISLIVSSFNMHFIVAYAFHIENTLPHILTFLIYTLAGLGMYVMYIYINTTDKTTNRTETEKLKQMDSKELEFTSEGKEQRISFGEILYVESLENYIKLITIKTTFLIRHSMKEMEKKLPGSEFIRISRSTIINTSYIEFNDGETMKVKNQSFRIGKVYKRYVEEQLRR